LLAAISASMGDAQTAPKQLGKNAMTSISAHLDVQILGAAVLASLTIRNDSDADAYLEKSKVFADGEVTNDLFIITAADALVPYKGIMVKRNSPAADDFLTLPPGKEFKTTVDLSKTYSFPPGKHAYAIHYKAYHSYPSRDDFWILRSNDVTFSLHR
jgi:hypothetical protein